MDEAIESLGIEFEYKLVKDDFDGRQGSSHWKCTISRNGHSHTFDYSQGCAYRNFYGKPVKLAYGGERISVDRMNYLKATIPNNPDLKNVLYCLVSDAQSVDGVESFEEWASELGYDTDSRKAERAYNACKDTFLKMHQMFDLEQLYELFQDY